MTLTQLHVNLEGLLKRTTFTKDIFLSVNCALSFLSNLFLPNISFIDGVKLGKAGHQKVFSRKVMTTSITLSIDKEKGYLQLKLTVSCQKMCK